MLMVWAKLWSRRFSNGRRCGFEQDVQMLGDLWWQVGWELSAALKIVKPIVHLEFLDLESRNERKKPGLSKDIEGIKGGWRTIITGGIMSIVLKSESYAIMGACFEVYNDKGCGFLEPVYQECMEIELALRCVTFQAHASLGLSYKGRALKQRYVPDFVAFDQIIVELKAVTALTDEHRAQVHNYLKAGGYRLGLLVNFGHYPKLEYERIVR